MRSLWPLDPDVVFLNHGSYGACPTAVLAVQDELRARMERDPVRFLGRELVPLLDDARETLADFVGADAEDLAFVANATTGVNTVLRSLALEPGDEVLTTDHAYPACRNALDGVAAARGARVIVAAVPFPLESAEHVVAAVRAAVTPRTRLALLDHVTSPTGLVLPIERLVRDLAALGVETLVDGAHAPGMVPLDLAALGAAYYTGNCHKWLCAPKGSAFLHVRRDRHDRVRPLVLSHGATADRTHRSRFRLEFDWTGTDDPTAHLAVPAAIRFMGSLLPGGWPALMAANRATALAARRTLTTTLGAGPPCPDGMIGSLAALPLPAARSGTAGWPGSAELQAVLYERFAIEVPVIPWPAPPLALLRVSAQVYNQAAEYEALARALGEVTRARRSW